MARSDVLKREIATLKKKGADLSKDLSKHRDAAAKAAAASRKKRDQAARTTSVSTRKSALSAAAREDKKEVDARKKFAAVEKKIAENAATVARRDSSLTTAEKSERTAKDREDGKRRRAEVQHARQVAQASRPATAIRYVEISPPKPEPLRVLYVTSNPEAMETTTKHPDGTEITEGVWLRTEREIRMVKDALRRSKYRELVAIEHLPAATTTDVLDGLNDHRPHVVHFSGHANSLGLLMENEAGTQEGDDLDFSLLARLLSATDEPPRLLVLNACESLAGADDLLQTVPTVVAMSDSINDASAVVFATQFYSGIGSAQSVASALKQARVAMDAASLEGSDLPEARARQGVDLDALVLVQPPR